MSGVTTGYVLNALGQRVKKSNASLTRYFVYDEAGHLLGEYDGTGALIQETVWLNDTPVATLRPNGASVSLYYVHTDHLNTPRRVSRPSDNVIVWRWDSDPFGTTAANEDPDGDSVLFAYNLRMPGQYFDAESGANYNYFRDYDPYTGRYIQSDPIGLGGGINTYAYVGGNPVGYSDPTGLAPPGRAQPGYGVLSLFPPGPFDESWNASVNNTALELEDWLNRAVKAVVDACKDKDDDQCDKILDRSLLRQAGILGQEHEVKADALGTNKSLSLFDLCGCKDGRVVVKAHGCKGPIVSETGYRWK
jgi:RHS repeat-associated protein